VKSNKGEVVMIKMAIKQIALRLPIWIAQQLIDEARQLNIPLHSHIIMILMNHVNERK
jgi:hypothetical protein